jgi:protein-disulfide isomerase
LAATGFCTQIISEPAVADDEALGITREQAGEILQELKSIRELLEEMNWQQGRPAQPTPSASGTVRVATKGRPALGANNAPVTIVEFTDYECPFCKRFHRTTFGSLKRDYIDTGKVRWIVLDLPLPMHPNAKTAAQVAHCAGEQDHFWEMRTVLFEKAPLPKPESLSEFGQQLGLDQQAFDDCLASDKYLDQIDADSEAATEIRVTGTPTFIVGKSRSDWIDGQKIVGAQSFAVFDGAIRLLLSDEAPDSD